MSSFVNVLLEWLRWWRQLQISQMASMWPFSSYNAQIHGEGNRIWHAVGFQPFQVLQIMKILKTRLKVLILCICKKKPKCLLAQSWCAIQQRWMKIPNSGCKDLPQMSLFDFSSESMSDLAGKRRPNGAASPVSLHQVAADWLCGHTDGSHPLSPAVPQLFSPRSQAVIWS